MPNLACPSCGKNLSIPDTLLGKNASCPGCQNTFTATDPAASTVSEDEPAPFDFVGDATVPDDAPWRTQDASPDRETVPADWKKVMRGLELTSLGAQIMLVGSFIVVLAFVFGHWFVGDATIPICLSIWFLSVLGGGAPGLMGGWQTIAVPAETDHKSFARFGAVGLTIFLGADLLATVLSLILQVSALQYLVVYLVFFVFLGIAFLGLAIGGILYLMFLRGVAVYFKKERLASTFLMYIGFVIVGPVVIGGLGLVFALLFPLASVGLICALSVGILAWYAALARDLCNAISRSFR